MKILYFDCFAGISGNMCIGAFLGLGVEKEQLVSELNRLNIGGWELETSIVAKHGVHANYVTVATEEGGAHRTFADIRLIIDGSSLSQGVKRLATNIFRRVAAAEAKIHNQPENEVHFHEVGAIDSIVDIVGAAICVDILKPDRICSSMVNDGRGFIKCRHGVIPVPVPAVMEIFAERNTALRQIDVEAELVTPTGAAIIAELADSFGLMPAMNIRRVAYGAGSRDLDIPNVLRATLGETDEKTEEEITVIETNIDDCSPEILGYVMEKLYALGARDVFFTNIQMKKNRPGVKLTVLCCAEDAKAVEGVLFRETSTIGVRKRVESRRCLPREVRTVNGRYGDMRVKASVYDGYEKLALEYESAKLLAEASDVPLQAVYDALREDTGASHTQFHLK